MGEKSLLELFDDYRRKVREVVAYDCTSEFLIFARNVEHMRKEWAITVEECQRLKKESDVANSKISSLEKKLERVRYHIDGERKRARNAEKERDEVQDQLFQIQEILCNVHYAGNQFANETKEKIDKFLNITQNKVRTSLGEMYGGGKRLNTIDEINSTGETNGRHGGRFNKPRTYSSSRSSGLTRGYPCC